MAARGNIARMLSQTSGTGTLTLDSPVPGFLSFEDAGIQDDDVVSYVIENGHQREVGRGVYSSETLTRSPLASTDGGAAIDIDGPSEVFISALVEDFDSPVSIKSNANYTITRSDDGEVIGFPLTTTNRTATLPAANSVRNGFKIGVLLVSTTTATLTIARAGADTFDDGGTAFRLSTRGDVVWLVSNGVSTWYVVRRSVARRRFLYTSSGTHTFTPGCRYFEVEVIGAGGGAGGTNQTSGAGAGGGAGGYSTGTYLRPITMVSGTVAIGASGSGGGIDGSNGGAGGNSSWADGVRTLVGNGGGGGTGDTTGTSFKQPGAGGTATGGQINITGGTGGWASPGFSAGTACWNGGGGMPAAYGAADVGFVLNAGFTNGLAGKGFGAGGQGPNRASVGVTGSGGAGAPGLVVVTEYF